jgi:DNA repair protein RecO (recombination protein O)
MPLYNVEAINLRTRNTGEADKVIILFARGHGKIAAIAKGARRPGSKFGGRLEVFTYNQLSLATAKSLDIISQCETIESFFRIREDRAKLSAGFYLIKIVDVITEDRQVNDQLFQILLEALMALDADISPQIVIRSFEAKVCRCEGLMPLDSTLARIYARLPYVVSVLSMDYSQIEGHVEPKDLKVSAKVFKDIITDHVGKEIKDTDLEI